MKTIILDMYGVIIKESKGNFIPYTYNYFPVSKHEKITKLFKQEKIFTKAGNGEINSDEFLSSLGFIDTTFHMKDYIENYLTIDQSFYKFAKKFKKKFKLVLLSNDVSEWSKYITEFYKLNDYFTNKIVSGDVKCRKPNKKIYEITLKQINEIAENCIFVDNSVDNLNTANSLNIDTILFNSDNENYGGKIVYSFDELSNILDCF